MGVGTEGRGEGAVEVEEEEEEEEVVFLIDLASASKKLRRLLHVRLCCLI